MCHNNQLESTVPIKSPKSPWKRFFSQPLKPKLPRSVTNSARVNLNKYWNKFEEMTSLNRSPMTLIFPLTNATDENAINDNLINERTENGNLIGYN